MFYLCIRMIGIVVYIVIVILDIGDSFIFFILQHTLILGLIFWGLTSLAEYFYSKKQYRLQKDFYECGFKSISNLNLSISNNFFIFAVLLVLYDVEFILVSPYIIGSYTFDLNSYILYCLFVFLLIFSFYLDWRLSVLSWGVY